LPRGGAACASKCFFAFVVHSISIGKQFSLPGCRYASKAALVDVHQKSPAYARFKEATAGLEFKEKAGQSYYETDLGFVPS